MEAQAVLVSAGCGHTVWRSGYITYLLGLSEVTASAVTLMFASLYMKRLYSILSICSAIP